MSAGPVNEKDPGHSPEAFHTVDTDTICLMSEILTHQEQTGMQPQNYNLTSYENQALSVADTSVSHVSLRSYGKCAVAYFLPPEFLSIQGQHEIQEGSVLKNAAFNTTLPCQTRRVAECDAAIFLSGGMP